MVKYVMATLLLCVGLGAYAGGEPSRLYAGTAKVDITPGRTVISTGESFRLPDKIAPGEKTPPDNVHDPLYARVIVLKNKDVSLAVVSVDLILFSSKRVIDEAKKQWGLEHVILSSTHNHSGMMPRGLSPTGRGQAWSFAQEDPGVSLDWPGFSEDPWYAETEKKIVAAIGAAMANRFPARIVAGKGPYDSVYLGHNRRYVNPNGRVTMMWDNPKRIPNGPQDPTIGVIRIEDQAGKPRVLLVHYACHAVTMMGDRRITADFPGAMADYIEGELGESCMAMFLQGAEGDQDPYEMRLRGTYGFNMIKQSGVSLAKAALRVAKDLPSPGNPEVSLRIEETTVKIPYRKADKASEACVMTIVINDELALVTIPGEPFIQHQLNLSERSPVPNTFMLGVAYCGRGSPFLIYIPTIQAVKEGGYGASECSYVSADAGDRMVNAAVASIKELLAR